MKVVVKRRGLAPSESGEKSVNKIQSNFVSQEDAEAAMGAYYKCKSSLLYAQNNGRMVLDGQYVSYESIEQKMNDQIPVIDAYFVQTGHPTLSQMQERTNQRFGEFASLKGYRHCVNPTAAFDGYQYLNRYVGTVTDKLDGNFTMPEMLSVQMMYEGVLKESQRTKDNTCMSFIDKHPLALYEVDKLMAKQLAFLEVGENRNGLAQSREPGSAKRQIAYMPGGRGSNPMDYTLIGMSQMRASRRLPSVDMGSADRQCDMAYDM